MLVMVGMELTIAPEVTIPDEPSHAMNASRWSDSSDRDPGYVYLSMSKAMPGFVQVDHSAEDPSELTWSLQTYSGVTHFRTVFAVQTSDCAALKERFCKAVPFDQIPHHADFFKIRLRLARNILETEGKAFPPSHPAPPPDRRVAYGVLASIGLSLVTAVTSLLIHEGHTAQAKAATTQVAAAPAVAKVAPAKAPEAKPAEAPALGVKPRFRFSKM